MCCPCVESSVREERKKTETQVGRDCCLWMREDGGLVSGGAVQTTTGREGGLCFRNKVGRPCDWVRYGK